jgi:hypothetical protein
VIGQKFDPSPPDHNLKLFRESKLSYLHNSASNSAGFFIWSVRDDPQPPFESMTAQTEVLAALKAELLAHPLYAAINRQDELQAFMERHIICVWDFMTLVKSLQSDLCGTQLPWTPPKQPEAARLLTDIVLAEESEQLPDGRILSHFELYLEAMEEVGADCTPIRSLVTDIQSGTPVLDALQRSTISVEAQNFTRSTLALLEEPVHVRAAVFYYSREEMIPEMFTRLLNKLKAEGFECQSLQTYLDLHIECDAEEHGPAALKLLSILYGGSMKRRQDAEHAAIGALKARMTLWTETLAFLLGNPPVSAEPVQPLSAAS